MSHRNTSNRTETDVEVTTTATPHPDVQAILDGRAELGIPRLSSLSVGGMRQLLEELWAPPADPEPVAAVRDVSIDGPAGDVPIRIYTPDGSGPFPVLVYFHGGGWVAGGIELDDGICRALTNAAGCAVASIGYRHAPEHPFPAPLEDCYAATEWVVEHSEVAHGDPDRIAVVGESAGGNLAAAVAQVARDRGGPALAHQVLVTPVLDRSFDRPSYDIDPSQLVITRADVEWVWDRYLESDLDANNPYASPLRARDLSGLPSATIVTAGFDVLRDEGLAYAERLEDAGVRVTYREYDDVIHGFLGMLDDPALERAREVIDAVARDLRDSFGG
ncbi:alpha/beta hydrolase [Halomarina pelagica]|uniref:alpha/beta hydrolase n=1 Tax=Halomarina pelagica TaxID=2961599 RepID=UPI0020C2316C|nr:alpha/beta hydrolase [Halomarina sp. BND7]